MIKLGSLFDGISGFPYIAQRLGIKPVWASEIERAAIAISKKHFPKMEHLGDITKIDGSQIEPVHVVTFGSPCQDLSVAGRGKGLDGERSGLFREAVRIIREMRVATDRVYPRFALWENVPGAFSSNGGQDFRAVLSELAEAEVPMPQSGKWATAGMVELRDRRIFWRVLDAQYWGVPQRRKRIFLVTDFGNKCGPEILFKPESVRGDIEESNQAEKEASENAREGFKKQVRSTESTETKNHAENSTHNPIPQVKAFGDTGIGYWSEGFKTLRAEGENRPSRPSHVVVGFQSNASISDRQPVLDEKIPTMRTTSDSAVAIDCRNHSIGVVSGTLQAKSNGGQSLNYINPVAYGICSYESNSMKSPNPHSGIYEAKVARTIDQNGGNPACNQGGIAILHPEVVSTILASGAGFSRSGGSKGSEEDCYVVTGWPKKVTSTLDSHFGDKQGLEDQHVNSGCPLFVPDNNYQVRRLTPTECERLQDFPDGWTEWGEVYFPSVNSKKLERDLAKGMLRLGITQDQLLERISDSARYQTLGNSIAIPCGEYALEGIATALREVAQ